MYFGGNLGGYVFFVLFKIFWLIWIIMWVFLIVVYIRNMKYDFGIVDIFMSIFLIYLLDVLGYICNIRNKNMLCFMVLFFDFKSYYMELLLCVCN